MLDFPHLEREPSRALLALRMSGFGRFHLQIYIADSLQKEAAEKFWTQMAYSLVFVGSSIPSSHFRLSWARVSCGHSLVIRSLHHNLTNKSTYSGITARWNHTSRRKANKLSASLSEEASVLDQASNISITPATKPATFKLSPSDFAFLWDACQRCFYLKVHKLLPRPQTPFPRIFNTIDSQMKEFFRGVSTQDIDPKMKAGIFLCEEKDAWVQSKPLVIAGHKSQIVLQGMIDCLAKYDDGTYGVVDFKTSSVSKYLQSYSRQLHAYAICLESAAEESKLPQLPVSDLSLIVYEPVIFRGVKSKLQSAPSQSSRIAATPTTSVFGRLDGNLAYVPVARDDSKFYSFLSDVLDVLEKDIPPAPFASKHSHGGGCVFCQYLQDGLASGHIFHTH